MSVNVRKVAVIGCGFVGSSSAFAIMQSGLFSEMVLLDVNQAKAEGEAMDISHGTALVNPMKVYAGTYDDIADAAIIVVTAGAAQKPGETRLDLIHKNVGIFSGIMKEIRARKPEGIMLVVANPVDILTYYAARTSGMGEGRVSAPVRFLTPPVCAPFLPTSWMSTAVPFMHILSVNTATVKSYAGPTPTYPAFRFLISSLCAEWEILTSPLLRQKSPTM